MFCPATSRQHVSQVTGLIVLMVLMTVIGPGLRVGGDTMAEAATFTVTSANDVDDGTCDATHCSLREAVNAANAASGADLFRFAIASGGTKTIAPTSPLPPLTEAVTELSNGHVSDEVYARAATVFTERELGQVIAMAVTINAWNRINVTIGLEPPRR